MEDSHITNYFEPDNCCPYLGWRHYLPEVPYSQSSSVIKKLECSMEYLKTNSNIKREELFERKYFSVDMDLMIKDEKVKESWPTLREEVEISGESVCGILGLAKHHATIQEIKAEDPEISKPNFPVVRARILVQQNVTPLRALKSSFYGRLVTVKGTIVRISNMRPANTWLAFSCSVCLSEFPVHQPEGKFTTPLRCRERICKNMRNFTPVRNSRQTLTVDMQQVRLQEVEESEEGGRVPRTIDIELLEDNCDSCVPGDIVTVTGVVKVIAEEGAGGKTTNKGSAAANANSVYLMYITALSLHNSRSKGTRSSTIGIDFTYNDFAAIQEIHSFGGEILKLLVSSLAPAIFGHHLVKAALLLGLFGGTSRTVAGTEWTVRGDPHILVVGDPGLGKSQMLSSVAGVAPRGVFVTGNTTTTAGLTVTLARDSGNDSAIEAGALVLADQGCCCIDEFDKMSASHHQALLEAMEQQSISIAKAGVVCSLPARTAILAAANPVGGHYNRAKTVSENLRLGPALLSRFDLVFILIDRPDQVMDSLLSDHVMSMHVNSGKFSRPPTTRPSQAVLGVIPAPEDGRSSLKARLLPRPEDPPEEPLPPTLLRKYIAYARKFVFPKLTPAACTVLQDFYLTLRRNHHSSDGTPITTRQLESLIRLTEARAKMELREEATEEDARDVVEIMKQSICDAMVDELGALDLNRSHMGSGMSQRNAGKRLVSALQKQGQNLLKNTFTLDEIKQVARLLSIPGEKVFDLVSSLNNQGFLIMRPNKVYQLMSLDS